MRQLAVRLITGTFIAALALTSATLAATTTTQADRIQTGLYVTGVGGLHTSMNGTVSADADLLGTHITADVDNPLH
ncbi:hypothetical protein OG394_13940 [Kribbella sp. NBC_01245]|uniref:hypothetical protein n=1 Tax=Kribbella sp. NBC_01245 TaxID=2903578 RepID=UPI002E29762D|nr:hypothetical protein [Kribbella sp. NBC_01245]